MQKAIVNMPKELYAALKAFSEKTGMPMAEAVRRAVTEFLEKHNGLPD